MARAPSPASGRGERKKSFSDSHHPSRGAFRARVSAHLLRASPKGEAERRQTRELGVSSLSGWRCRSGTPPAVCETVCGMQPSLAIGKARLSALHLRFWRKLCFRSVPGHASCIALLRCPSASSWREVRSDLQVEPRAARDRHACRAREPPKQMPSHLPRKYQRLISGAFLRPAPPKRCLARAPQGSGLTYYVYNPILGQGSKSKIYPWYVVAVSTRCGRRRTREERLMER
jgi:hypothetical protein